MQLFATLLALYFGMFGSYEAKLSINKIMNELNQKAFHFFNNNPLKTIYL